ncbi:glycosyltransferase family 2 protein [Polycladospora coralii]|uniref:glycosyltransferase family 2 protein n=1 Tax=Polycladospora coralii TaxID=2771432 RepID=UPI0020BFD11B|nr:glycosyltransferase family 2 protein [Polycladospora coralii]
MSHKMNEKVTIAILAKDKEHILPYYLRCIEEQTYPSEQINLYIRTNNNTDHTAHALENWIESVQGRYGEIYFDASDVAEPIEKFAPHEWNGLRFKILGGFRQDSIKWALQRDSHYFVVDCDNFIAPDTLEKLYQTGKPVIAPFLINADQPNLLYSNFHAATDEHGYFKENELYYQLFYQKIKGTYEVDVVHCTYFIRNDILEYVQYLDGSGRHEYVIFSDGLRKQNIPQYLDNRKLYGKITFANHEGEFNRNNFSEFIK